MDQWDPMKEAFENKRFNSYIEGVGRDLSDTSQHNNGVSLFVQNIPESLGKTGFYNLFAEHGPVIHHTLILSDRNPYGFIVMQNMLDAEKAISKLNNKRLGQCTLRVSPALSKEERMRRKKLRQDEEQFQSFIHRDDADRSNLQDRQQSRGIESAALAQNLSDLELNKHDWPQSQVPGIGRGSNIRVSERGDGIDSFQRNLLPNIGMGRGGRGTYEAYSKVAVETATKSDPAMKEKVCVYCGIEDCVNRCSRCQSYYCSVDCQKKDWPRHQDICITLGTIIRGGTYIEPGTKGDRHYVNNPQSIFSNSDGEAAQSCFNKDTQMMMKDRDVENSDSTVNVAKVKTCYKDYNYFRSGTEIMSNKASDTAGSSSQNISDTARNKAGFSPQNISDTSRNKAGFSPQNISGTGKNKGGFSPQNISDTSRNKAGFSPQNISGTGKNKAGFSPQNISDTARNKAGFSPQNISDTVGDKAGVSMNASKLHNKTNSLVKSNLNTCRSESGRDLVEQTNTKLTDQFKSPSKRQNNNSSPQKNAPSNPKTSSLSYEQNISLPTRTTQEVNKFRNNENVLEEMNLVTKETVFERTSGRKAATDLSSVQENPVNNTIFQVEDSKKTVSKKFHTNKSEEALMRSPNCQKKMKEFVKNPNQQSLNLKAEAEGYADAKAAALEARSASPLILELSLDIKTSGSCYLTHYESPYKFWISLGDFLEVFTENTLLMAREISRTCPSNPVDCKIGETYGIMYMGEWSRATILSNKNSEATIFLCDYGNQIVVKQEDLRPLTMEMLQLPAQAVCCSVSKLKPKGSESWNEAACTAVKEWLGEPMSKFLQYETLAKGDSVHAVDISINNMSMSEVLLSGGFAERVNYEPGLILTKISKSVDQESPRYMAHELPNKMDEIKNEDKIPVVLSDFISMHKFMVLAVSSDDFLNDLTLLLQTEYSDSTTSYRPIQGELVVAKFSKDGNWYRAEAINIDGDNCTLFFVDYGNSEVQTVNNIRRVTNQKVLDVPKQSIICSLFLTNVLSDWGGDIMDIINQEFHNLLVASITSEGYGLLVVKEKTNDTLLVDFLASSGLCLSEVLTQRLLELSIDMQHIGSAEQSEGQNISKVGNFSSQAEQFVVNDTVSELETEALTTVSGNTVSVEISFVESIAEFYVRQNSKHKMFISMMKELNKSVMSSPVLPAPSIGILAAAQSSQYHIWYRGIIEKSDGQKCLVYFIDYGNREEIILSNLRILPPSVPSLPAQAIKCHLHGKLEYLSRAFLSEFKHNLENKTVDVKMCGNINGSISVQVFLDGRDICQDQQITPERTIENSASNSDMEIFPDSGKQIQAIVTHIDSCSRLFISRKDENLQYELCQLMIKLNNSASSLPSLENPVEGSVCVAQYSQDSTWYRARVVEICNNTTCIVQFVDYGNMEETLMSKLRKLEPAMTILPDQAICCCLFGFESDLSPAIPQQSSETTELIQKLRTELGDKSFTVTVVDKKLGTWIIKMEDENGDCVSRTFRPPPPPPPHLQTSSAPKLSDLIFEAPLENEFDVFFSHINNFSDFYCQRCSKEVLQELHALNEKLRDDVSKCDGDFNQEPVVNGVYASRFEDNWYRCVVEEVRLPHVLIRYIDYGNSEMIPAIQLRPLNPDRLVVPVRIFKCKLHGVLPVQGHWNHPAMGNYLSFLPKHTLHLMIDEKENDTFLVSLSFMEGSEKVNVAEDLVRMGMAVFSQVSSPRKENETPMLPSSESLLCESDDKVEESEEEESAEDIELKLKILQMQLKLSQKKKKQNKL